MPDIILKKSPTTGVIPDGTELSYGELALNYADGKLYYKNTSDEVKLIQPSEFASAVSITDATSAISNTTGALKVTGGISTQENFYAGGTGTFDGVVTITDDTEAINTTTGSLVLAGGIGIEKDLHINGIIHLMGPNSTIAFGDYDVSSNDGKTWWVQPNGIDNNPDVVLGAGRQLWTAFATIKNACKYAQFGDTILVQPGEYEEVFPLYVPAGVSLRGAGLRETQIYPTLATNSKDAFLISGDATISDFTVKDFFYNSGNDTGYAFRFATYTATLTSGIATVTVADTTALVAGQTITKISGTGAFGSTPTIATVDSATQITVSVNHATSGSIVFSTASVQARSTYIERATVFCRGSVTSGTDFYGYAQGDAGRGALIDGSIISRSSLQAAMLFNEVTFIVPTSRAIVMTNGARCEMLTSFVYFADLAIEGVVGTAGRGMDGKTYLTFSGISGAGFSAGETIRFIGTGGTPTVDFTAESVNGSKVTVDGSLNTLNGLDLSPGAGGSITGLTSSTTATAITRYDRSEFAAELRAIACATEYGNQGVKADGADVILQIMSHNFAYTGTGADLTNDKSAVNQANEVIEVNGGKVYYNSVDQAGNYRVGDSFLVDFETGAVTFSGGTFDVTALGSINFVDGANVTAIDALGVSTGNISIAGNSITTTTGNLTLDPSGAGTIALTGGTTVTGTFTATGATTLTANIASSSTTEGTLVVTGGVGISEDLYVGGNIVGNVIKANNLAGGAANQIAYQSALDTTAFAVAPTTSGTFLRWNGTAFDWQTVTAAAAGSNTEIQFNSGGSLASSANFTYNSTTNVLALTGTDTEILLNGITTEPAAPSAGQLYLYSKSISGRMMPKWVGPSGFDTAFQSWIAGNKIAVWNSPAGGTTVPGVWGFNTMTTSGTITARTTATTNLFTRAKKIGYNNTNTAGTVAGNREPQANVTLGTGTIGVGGFHYVIRFGFSDNVPTATAASIRFVGLRNSTAAPGATDNPATFTQTIGIGARTGDTNFFVFYGGTAAQTPINLGANFPAKTANTDWYEFMLFAPSNSNNTVTYRLTRLNTGDTAEGTLTAATPGTQLPSSTTLLAHRIYNSNNATAGTMQVDIGNIYMETDT